MNEWRVSDHAHQSTAIHSMTEKLLAYLLFDYEISIYSTVIIVLTAVITLGRKR